MLEKFQAIVQGYLTLFLESGLYLEQRVEPMLMLSNRLQMEVMQS